MQNVLKNASQKNDKKLLLSNSRPNARCKFPFLDLKNGTHHTCTNNYVDKLDGLAYRKVNKKKKLYTRAFKLKDKKGKLITTTACHLLWKYKGYDPWNGVDYVLLQGKRKKKITKCYAPKNPKKQTTYCATCNPNAKRGKFFPCMIKKKRVALNFMEMHSLEGLFRGRLRDRGLSA